jgi:hypothetical protein
MRETGRASGTPHSWASAFMTACADHEPPPARRRPCNSRSSAILPLPRYPHAWRRPDQVAGRLPVIGKPDQARHDKRHCPGRSCCSRWARRQYEGGRQLLLLRRAARTNSTVATATSMLLVCGAGHRYCFVRDAFFECVRRSLMLLRGIPYDIRFVPGVERVQLLGQPTQAAVARKQASSYAPPRSARLESLPDARSRRLY